MFLLYVHAYILMSLDQLALSLPISKIILLSYPSLSLTMSIRRVKPTDCDRAADFFFYAIISLHIKHFLLLWLLLLLSFLLLLSLIIVIVIIILHTTTLFGEYVV